MGGENATGYDLMLDIAASPVKFGSKLALLAGFGGVLLLMAVAGLDSVRVLHRIEDDHRKITQSFLAKRHALEGLQSSLWFSGSLVRDYLLQADSAVAASDLTGLRRVRQEMDTAIRQYSGLAQPEQQAHFAELQSDLEAYWKTLEPVLRWNSEDRRRRGYSFLTTEVFPRREAMLRTADKIDAINELALSADDQRSAELFASFRRRTIAMLAVTLGIGLVLAAAAITRILRLERDARLRYQEILRARGELERLSASLVQAQEEERRAISRELHDEVGQSLSALLVDLGNLSAATPDTGDPGTARLLATARKLAEDSVSSVRNMALLLRPSMLDDFGLVPALNWQAREVSRRTGMRVSVAADEVGDDLPDRHNTCVYRVVQEALHNCARHSEAKAVRIVVAQEAERLRLTITDDGKGFDPRRIRGLGLVGMAERVKHLGGAFEVESHPGKGTVVKVELPLEPKEARPQPVSI